MATTPPRLLVNPKPPKTQVPLEDAGLLSGKGFFLEAKPNPSVVYFSKLEKARVLLGRYVQPE